MELLSVVVVAFAAALIDAVVGGWAGDDLSTTIVILGTIVIVGYRYRRRLPSVHVALALLLEAPAILGAYVLGLAIDPHSDTRTDELVLPLVVLAIGVIVVGRVVGLVRRLARR